MSDTQAQARPETAPGTAPETVAAPPAPEPAPKPEKTPRRARSRGVPAVPAALASANTVAVAGGWAASVGGPAAGIATAGALVAGAVGLGLKQRRRVKRSAAIRAARDVARRNGMAVSPAAVRSGRWTPTSGGGGSRRTGTGSTASRSAGTGPTRSRSVKSPLGARSGSAPTRSGSRSIRSKGPGKHRKLVDPTRTKRSDRSGSKSKRSDPRSPLGSRSVRTGPKTQGAGSGSKLRKVLGPRPATGPRSTRGGLVNRGDGSRRQPIHKTRAAARKISNGASKVGKGAVQAYRSRPAQAARRWSIGATKRAWGVVGPAVGAALSGVNAAMRRRGWRGVFQAMGKTWGNLRAKWAPKSKHAKAKAEADPAKSAPADTVERPQHVTTTGPRPTDGPARLTGGVSMQQARIIEGSREMVGAAMMYNPEGMMQIGNDFASFPEIIRNVANAIQGMTRQVQEGATPMHPAIVDQIRALHAQLIQVAAASEDLKPAFENLHAVDIKRIREPRPGEEMWDLASNRDYVGR